MIQDYIKEVIENISCDIDFMYKGIQGSICPFSADKISFAYGEKFKDYNNIDNALCDTQFFNGKNILEVCNEFEII